MDRGRGDAGASGGRPAGRVQQHHVQALPERARFEITFPRVEGYQQAILNLVVVNWEAIAPVVVDPTVIPDEALMKAFLPANDGRPRLSGPGALETIGLTGQRRNVRLQQHEFDLAGWLVRAYVELVDAEGWASRLALVELCTDPGTHPGGQRFEPAWLHRKPPLRRGFFVWR